MKLSTRENAQRELGGDTSNICVNHTAGTGIKQSTKRLIVSAALWGLIPASFASWLLFRLGLVSE